MDPDVKKFNMIFTKATSCIVPADSTLAKPKEVRFLDYEIELGLVLKRDITSRETVTEENLHEYLAGAVVVNDYSARDIQIPQMQLYKGKSYRTFGPVGPYLCLLERQDLPKLKELVLTLTVNCTREVLPTQSDSSGTRSFNCRRLGFSMPNCSIRAGISRVASSHVPLKFSKRSSIDDAAMADKARREGLRVLRPNLGTKPRVWYSALERWDTCFIGGSVSAQVGGATECVAGAAVSLYVGSQKMAETVSDAFGDFRFDGLAKGRRPIPS